MITGDVKEQTFKLLKTMGQTPHALLCADNVLNAYRRSDVWITGSKIDKKH